MQVFKYTYRMQEMLKCKVKAEPWMHVAIQQNPSKTQQNKAIYAVFIWDTRACIETGRLPEISDDKSCNKIMPGLCIYNDKWDATDCRINMRAFAAPYANDNHEQLTAAGGNANDIKIWLNPAMHMLRMGRTSSHHTEYVGEW